MNSQTAVIGRSYRRVMMMAPLIFVLVAGLILVHPVRGRAGTYFDQPAMYPAPVPVEASAMISGDFSVMGFSAGNFSQDGYTDLAFISPNRYISGIASNGGYATFALKFNDSSGDFSADPFVKTYTSGLFSSMSVTDAASLDIDGQGLPDLVWTSSTGYVFWAIGPNFVSPSPVRVGPRLEAIGAADFNADTYVDLVAADFTGKLYLLPNNGGSGYRSLQPIRPLCSSYDVLEVGDNPNALVAADFNRDGVTDLAVATSGGDRSDPGIFVLMNNPDCSGRAYDTVEPILETLVPQKLITADFNGDNLPDLAFSDAASTHLYALFNDSGGLIWDLSAPLDCGGSVGALSAGDLNDDGRPELICADAANAQVVVFAYDAYTRQFDKLEEVYAVGPAPSQLIVADVNGDEKRDLVTANSGDSTISVLINHYEPVIDLSQLVRIGEISNRKAYSLTPVAAGVPVYIDRPYAILDMSAGLEGGMLLQTANNDKWVRSEQHVQLWVHGEAVLMVCYDSRARRLPSWLAEDGWTQTMEWIRSSDHRAGTMQVYMKAVAGTMETPAEVWLGGNHTGGDTCARSNYYLIVQPKGLQPALPPVNIVRVSTGKSYKVARLQKGDRVYTDRSYQLIDYPDVLEGSVIVKTANNDKWVRDSIHLELEMHSDAAVFVGYDGRSRRLPAWLADGSWSTTGLWLKSTDHRAGPMKVMMQKVKAADRLFLGGNHEGGDTRARSNYVVIVQTHPVELAATAPPLVQVTGHRPFRTETAESGSRVYLDRTYQIEEISPGLQGGILVTTANNDKWYRGGNYLNLQVREKAYVYVCYDKRKRFLPRWLADPDWYPTPEFVLTSDRKAGPMTVSMRILEAGQTLTLGGNHQGGDNRTRSNYFLVVQTGQ